MVDLIVKGLRSQIVAMRKAASDKSPATWLAPAQIPSWATGLVERLFFTVAVAFDVSGSGPVTAMVAWVGIKMAADWGRLEGDHAGAFSALLGGLLSMLFALTGGLIIRGRVPIC